MLFLSSRIVRFVSFGAGPLIWVRSGSTAILASFIGAVVKREWYAFEHVPKTKISGFYNTNHLNVWNIYRHLFFYIFYIKRSTFTDIQSSEKSSKCINKKKMISSTCNTILKILELAIDQTIYIFVWILKFTTSSTARNALSFFFASLQVSRKSSHCHFKLDII